MSMSTPLHQLPQGAPPTNVKVDDDPAVAEMINELEKEMGQQKAAAHTQAAHTTHPAPVPTYHHPPAVIATPVLHAPPAKNAWWSEQAAKRAVILAVVAFAVFAIDFNIFYERMPMLHRFSPYDRFIRIVVLAVAFYVLFWKELI